MTVTSCSAAETEALGERLASDLQAGEILAFRGDLGAGKTAFVRGIARGLGITDPDGVRIEIMQVAPDSPQREAAKRLSGKS